MKNGTQETAYPRTVDARDRCIQRQTALKAAVDSVVLNTDPAEVVTRAETYLAFLTAGQPLPPHGAQQQQEQQAPPPQQQAARQDQRHQDVQRDVPAGVYQMDPEYDGERFRQPNPNHKDGKWFGAKAYREVEEGDWLLVKTNSGKRWPEIVTEVIRTATLQGEQCWICLTRKPPKNGNSSRNGNGYQQPGPEWAR